jgi:hypothetical protein
VPGPSYFHGSHPLTTLAPARHVTVPTAGTLTEAMFS